MPNRIKQRFLPGFKIFIISFTVTILSLQILSLAYAESSLKEVIKDTAKVTFFKNKAGNLKATIIPYTSQGSYPKSGWITCEIIHPDIVKIYSEKLKNQKESEGYFIATYRKIEVDKNSVILHYWGELLKIEPWNPPFLKNHK